MKNGEPVVVLVVEDDDAIRELWVRIIQAIPGITVLFASTAGEAIRRLHEAEILWTDWILGCQTADQILDLWMTEVGGPCCVVSGKMLSTEERYPLFERGVLNVPTKPISPGVIISIIRHYQRDVLRERALVRFDEELQSAHDALEVTNRKLAETQRLVWVLAALLASYIAGPELWTWVKYLLSTVGA